METEQPAHLHLRSHWTDMLLTLTPHAHTAMCRPLVLSTPSSRPMPVYETLGARAETDGPFAGRRPPPTMGGGRLVCRPPTAPSGRGWAGHKLPHPQKPLSK